MLKKKDAIIVTVVLLMAAVMAYFMYFRQGAYGERVHIMIDGEAYGTYPLMQDCVIEIENPFGYNKLVIVNGSAVMEAADCPDGYCVDHKPISKTNETIVCLPHKLVVEIHGVMQDDGIDGVVQR